MQKKRPGVTGTRVVSLKILQSPPTAANILTIKNGDNRTRTCDPLHVKQMLSQLSYVSMRIF